MQKVIDNNTESCYLCQSSCFSERSGVVRDNASIKILECQECGLVQLSSQEHILEGHYETSGMFDTAPPPIEEMLRAFSEDSDRRFKMLRARLPNQRVLDFGCGNGGFLFKAQTLAKEVMGIEPEMRAQEYLRDKLPIYKNLSCLPGGGI